MKNYWSSMTSFGNSNLPRLQRFCPWYQPTPINNPFWNDRVSVEYLILFSSHQTAFTRSIDPVKPLPEPLPVDPSLPCDPLGCDPLGWESLALVSPVDPPLPFEPLTDADPLVDCDWLPLELFWSSDPLADADWLSEWELLAEADALALKDPLPECDDSDELPDWDDRLPCNPHEHSLRSSTSQKSPGPWAYRALRHCPAGMNSFPVLESRKANGLCETAPSVSETILGA